MSDETDDQGATDDATDDEVPPGDDGRFDAAYVAQLRGEAAQRRREAREAAEAEEQANERLRALQGRLVELETAEACRGILADPADLLVHVDPADIMGDDGPDPERIKAAAERLVERKPYLAPRRPVVTGDVDQGAREPGPPEFDFAGLLRKAAG